MSGLTAMRAAKLPSARSVYDQKAAEFQEWLVQNGSSIFVPTNPYEVTRFLSMTGVGIIWTDKAGRLSYSPDAKDAYMAFLLRKPWRAIGRRPNRPNSKKRQAIVRNLMERDGLDCFYCTDPLTADTATIEHMIALTAGGTNHPSNLTLACLDCNHEADVLPVRAKLELAIRKRGGFVRRKDDAGNQRQAAQVDGNGPGCEAGQEDGIEEGDEGCVADERETT